MILLFGENNDTLIQHVFAKLVEDKKPALIVEKQDILSSLKTCQFLPYNSKKSFLKIKKNSLKISDIRGVFNRLSYFEQSLFDDFIKEDREYVYYEQMAHTIAFLNQFPNCINKALPFHLGGVHAKYPEQYLIASEHNIKTPNFIITPNKNEALSFIEKHRGQIIMRDHLYQYRNFGKIKNTNVKKIENNNGEHKEIYCLVQRPQGEPVFFHLIGKKIFSSKLSASQKTQSKMPGGFYKKMTKLTEHWGLRFSEIMFFEDQKKDLTFGYISPYPIWKHMGLNKNEILTELTRILWNTSQQQ